MPQTDLFHLNWRCCRDGYRFEDRTDPPTRKGRRASLIGGQAGRYIVRNSDRLYSTTPMRCVGLYRQLSDVSDDDGALEFVSRHGFLSRGKDARVDQVLNAAAEIRSLVDLIDKKRWARITYALNRVGQGSNFGSGGIGKLGVTFDWQEGMERPTLCIRPGSLLSAIFVQALRDASIGAELKKCDRPGCPKYFQVGPGTGRPRLNRGVAYCTPKCQKAHAYMRKEPKQ